MVHQTPSSVAIIYKICKGTLKVKLWFPWWIENEIVLMYISVLFLVLWHQLSATWDMMCWVASDWSRVITWPESWSLIGWGKADMMWCVLLVMMRWSGIDGIVLLMGHWAASQQPQHTEPLGPNNIKWSTNIRRGCYHSENLASASLRLREISLST